jgi:hypothetical protein
MGTPNCAGEQLDRKAHTVALAHQSARFSERFLMVSRRVFTSADS